MVWGFTGQRGQRPDKACLLPAVSEGGVGGAGSNELPPRYPTENRANQAATR